MVISKMAAKKAAITLKLEYLLNYLLPISREGVYHWVFWRHIYLYQSLYTDYQKHIIQFIFKNGYHFTK